MDKNLEQSLILDIYSNNVHFPLAGVSRNFEFNFPALEADLQDAYKFIAANDLIDNELSLEIINLFKDYGSKLFLAIFPDGLKEDLHKYKSLIVSNSSNKKLYFNLLHDQNNFLANYLTIAEQVSGKNVNGSQQTKINSYNISFLTGVYPGYLLKSKYYPNLNLHNEIWKNAINDNSIRCVSNGLITRNRLNDFFSKSAPNIIILTAYCDDQGIITVNEQDGSLEYISFFAFASYLKNAVSKGLQGIIFNLWDWQNNMAYQSNNAWLKTASLGFALQMNSLNLNENNFLTSFVLALIEHKNASKAYLKAFAKASINDATDKNSLIKRLTANFFINYYKDQFLQFELVQNAINFHESNFSSLIKRLASSSYFGELAIKINQAIFSNKKEIFINNSDYQTVIMQCYRALLLLKSQLKISIYELIIPFNSANLKSLEIITNSQNLDYSNLYDCLITFKLEQVKSSLKILILLGEPPLLNSFKIWYDNKLKSGWTIININIQLESQAIELSENQFNETWANSSFSFHRLNINQFSKSASFAKIIAWAVESKLISIESSINKAQMELIFNQFLEKDTLYLLVLMYICKSSYPKKLIEKIAKHNIKQSTFTKLIEYNILHLSLDAENIMLEPAIYDFITDSELIKSGKMQTIAMDAASNWQIDSSYSLWQIYPATSNLADHLAFRSEYRFALNLILNSFNSIIEATEFSVDHILIWSTNALVWGEKIDLNLQPNWAYSLWLNAITKLQEYMPTILFKNIIDYSLDSFAKIGAWGAYALVICDLAKHKFNDSKDLVSFLSLTNEAINAAKDSSKEHYHAVYISILAYLATIDNLELFEQFSEKFEFDFEFATGSNIESKSLILIDCWYLKATKSDNEKDMINGINKLLKQQLSLPAKLELNVCLDYYQYFKTTSPTIAISLLQRLYEIAIRLKDENLKKEVLTLLYDAYKEHDQGESELNCLLELLDISKTNEDLESIGKWSDKIAHVYFKQGDMKKNTAYYSLAKDPRQIFQV